MDLSDNDKKIYELLFYDARRSTREIARMVRMKQPSVHARIKKLESEGFISRYDGLINTQALPFIYKMYYVSLSPEQVKRITQMDVCYGLQELFGEFSHQIFCFFNNKKQIKEFEDFLPKRRISQLLTKSHRLGGTLFDIKRESEKYSENENKLKLDKLDIKLLHKIIIGGARKTIVQLAEELKTTAAVIKYRKKRLIKNGYFLYFVAQPGEAFKSLKIAYHVFSLDKNVDFKEIIGLPRCVVAYSGDKCLTVIQLSLSFNDYLEYSNKLIRELDPFTKELHSFFVDKPIVLNRLSERLFFDK
jgi:DNA-binding Lrp family transcriptional regulator